MTKPLVFIELHLLDNDESNGDNNDVCGKKIRLAGNISQEGNDNENNTGQQKSTDLFCDVRVDLKKLLLYLSADNIAPKKALANFVEGKLIHLFFIHDNICIQYLLPAIIQ